METHRSFDRRLTVTISGSHAKGWTVVGVSPHGTIRERHKQYGKAAMRARFMLDRYDRPRRNPPSEHLRRLPEPGKYAAAWKRLIDATTGRIPGYDPDAYDSSIYRAFGEDTANKAARKFRKALLARIAERGGERGKRGRRDDYDYQTSLHRDARAIRDYRTSRLVRPGSGLETAEGRRAAPDVHERFRDRDNPSHAKPRVGQHASVAVGGGLPMLRKIVAVGGERTRRGWWVKVAGVAPWVSVYWSKDGRLRDRFYR